MRRIRYLILLTIIAKISFSVNALSESLQQVVEDGLKKNELENEYLRKDKQLSKVYDDLDFFITVVHMVQNEYVEPVSISFLQRSAIDAMFDHVEPKSFIIFKDELAEQSQKLNIDTSKDFIALHVKEFDAEAEEESDISTAEDSTDEEAVTEEAVIKNEADKGEADKEEQKLEIVSYISKKDLGLTGSDITIEDNNFDIFGNMFEYALQKYPSFSSRDVIVESLIGMLHDLDPHSTILVGEDSKKLQEDADGNYTGLGIHVSKDEDTGYILVVSPIDGTPAYMAGIRAGDLISHVDDVDISAMEIDDATSRMKGPANTDVTLRVISKGQEPRDVIVTRAVVEISSVRSWIIDDSIGYVRIAQFNGNTSKLLAENIEQLKNEALEEEKVIRGYILDLRSNPGGLLSQAVEVSDLFLNRGEIVSIRGRDLQDMERYSATKGDITNGAPIVVLINPGTASASEIVAGALQDLDRAVVMGNNSFGKGSVQTARQLKLNGDTLKLTVSRYYTPSGRSIQAVGIKPDIESAVGTVEFVPISLFYRETDLENSLANQKDVEGNISKEERQKEIEEAIDAVKAKENKEEDASRYKDLLTRQKEAAEQDLQILQAINYFNIIEYQNINKIENESEKSNLGKIVFQD